MSDNSQELPKNTDESLFDQANVNRILNESTFGIPDLSQQVLAQFAQDIQNPLPCQYDIEFISAYYDRELHCEIADQVLLKHRIQTFEQHLPHCSPCNQSLGEMFEAMDRYRNHMYGLENQLEHLNIASQVMSRFVAEQQLLDETLATPAIGCGQYPAETLSSQVDGELPQEQAQEVQGHLTHCSPCQEACSALTLTQQQIQEHYTSILENNQTLAALNLWPRVQPELAKDASSHNVVPLHSAKRSKRWMQVSGMAIAASLLMVLFSGRALFPNSSPVAHKPVNTAALEEALLLDQRDAARKTAITASSLVTTVAYESPEAYLFSSESDLLTDEDLNNLNKSLDVSALVMPE